MVDDFGTANATLQDLTILPGDVLNVDESFTAGPPHRRPTPPIVMRTPCLGPYRPQTNGKIERFHVPRPTGRLKLL